MANRTLLLASGAVAIVGGFLMFSGGVTPHSIALWILPMLHQQVLSKLPQPAVMGATLAVDFIALLVALGGITVIFGGLFLLAGRKTTGRTFIALGGGAGLLGLSLALGYTVIVSGVGSVGSHVGYWVGVVLAVIARRVAAKG